MRSGHGGSIHAWSAWVADSAWRASALASVLLLSTASSLVAGPPGGVVRSTSCNGILSSLFRPSGGGEYRLVVLEGGASRVVGSGRLHEDGRTGAIDFAFEAQLPGKPSLRGRVRMLQPDGKGCYLRFHWERSGTGHAELPGNLDERVKADADLAERGILQFYFDSGKRFFQLDRKDRKSRLVLDYGLLVLQPVP